MKIDLEKLIELENGATPAPWTLAHFETSRWEDAALIKEVRNALKPLLKEIASARGVISTALRFIKGYAHLNELTIVLDAHDEVINAD